jgi:translation initiation factor IF-1
MYLVALVDGRSVRAGLAAAARHSVVRLIKGDRVQVQLSSADPGRGQITSKF